ncbi:hypothetical protein [Alcaligenes phenolicus]|uniref:hypothetical protein n=1 Tax=Alcaligenes phenolicus TaxID=232846 RepID=UPI002AA78D5D|nr:hypothetical protein [Alcaligenes phenolicus]
MEKSEKWIMLLIGLVGGWVISTAPSWLHASSDKHWWSIAEAVGTVGATLIGALSWVYVWRKDSREREHKTKVLLHEFVSPVAAEWVKHANNFFAKADRVVEAFGDGDKLERDTSLGALEDAVAAISKLDGIVLSKEDKLSINTELFQRVVALNFSVRALTSRFQERDRAGLVVSCTRCHRDGREERELYIDESRLQRAYKDLSRVLIELAELSCMSGSLDWLPPQAEFMGKMRKAFSPVFT